MSPHPDAWWVSVPQRLVRGWKLCPSLALQRIGGRSAAGRPAAPAVHTLPDSDGLQPNSKRNLIAMASKPVAMASTKQEL